MRKVLIAAVFALISFSGIYAQKVEKLSDVQEKYAKGKYDEAKEKLDKILEDPKSLTVPAVWYWKGNVYMQLAKADTAHQLGYDAAHEAFTAYKKYQELDPKNVLMTLEQNVGLFVLRDIYANKGDHFWGIKDFAKAFENFKKALEIEEYVNSKNFSYNNYSYPALDTTLVRYTAAAAYSAKREDEAMPYFERLADAKITDQDYRDIYGLLVQYHMGKGNTGKAEKYLALGKQLFPDEDYWLGIEIGDIGDDKAKRLVKLEELAKKYPENGTLALDYAIEMRNNTYIYDTKPADYTARQEKLTQALTKAVTTNPTSELAHYLLSEHYYMQISDIEEDLRNIRGTTAADVAKKKEMNAKLDRKYEELHDASLKAYELFSKADLSKMKIQDKTNYRKVVNQLMDYYTRKKNTERIAFYQNKLKELK